MSRSALLRRRTRGLLVFFLGCLVLSGLTAFALETELDVLSRLLGIEPSLSPDSYGGVRGWIATVAEGLRHTNAEYPFIAYGTDWLAFGHLAIAVFFLGPLRDPVRNAWVVTAGMIVCAGVIPLALIAGEFRGIPLGWRLIDCSFGLFGVVPLWLARRSIRELQSLAAER